MLYAAVASFLAGAISVTPADGCPAAAAIADELGRLGALAALAQVGTAEVEAGQPQLHIVIRDRQGIVLGSRTVEAPADCSARAALAAVLIAAWTGDWIKTNMGGAATAPALGGGAAQPAPRETHVQAKPTRAQPSWPSLAPLPAAPGDETALVRTAAAPEAAVVPPPVVDDSPRPSSAPAASPSPAASPPAPAQSAFAPVHAELAALVFGMHDGDAGTFGGGVAAALSRRAYFLVALVEGVAERQRSLPPGSAGYGQLRMGIGAGARKSWRRVFVDLALVPELAHYALRGIDLTGSQSVVAWGFVADGRARLGFAWGRVAPFTYVGANWSLLRERLWVDGQPGPVTLSRANLAAGLGISFTVR
jgi:hypothetical protein